MNIVKDINNLLNSTIIQYPSVDLLLSTRRFLEDKHKINELEKVMVKLNKDIVNYQNEIKHLNNDLKTLLSSYSLKIVNAICHIPRKLSKMKKRN